ncbi:MAG: NCS2 family permease [Candidatus Competibacter denitrificans]
MFSIQERGSSVSTEILAGTTTFLTIAYILFLNPKMLADAGMPIGEAAVMIALCGAICAVLMCFLTDLPFVLAPGVGMSSFFAYGAVLGYGIDWRVALAAAFVAGMIFFLLVLVGLRNFLYLAFPQVVRVAMMVGIGMFLAIIGFENAGLTIAHPATLISLGKISSPNVLLAFSGLLLMGALMAWHVKGAILIGIITITAIAWLTGLSPAPQTWFALPNLTGTTVMAMDFSQITTGLFVKTVIAFLFLAVLDVVGTLSGVSRLGGLMDKDGKISGSHAAYGTDALGIMVGSIFGTSPNTVFIESAVGMQVGGRTGLTALTVGFLFFLSLFFIPAFVAIPAIATAPALIIVGAMMMRGATDLEWTRAEDIIPAFLTLATMAFGFNVAHGVALGVISYVILYTLRGRFGELNWAMFLMSFILAIYLGFYF